jgi:tRNA(Arg) A34 adenosine deaminase TadA
MKRQSFQWYLYFSITTALSLMFLICNIILPGCPRLKPKLNTRIYQNTLDTLARKALVTNDVPVAACIFYKDSMIGCGYNTVIANHNIAGHAEINAINDAVSKIGMQNFNQLNKKYIKLITTFEPCAMCKGALIETGITQVTSILPKTMKDKFLGLKKEFKYYINQSYSTEPYFQYQYFKLHPDFDSTQYPFAN